MVEGVITAAGKSVRTGEKYKMTLDFGGQTLIEKTVASMKPFCRKIILVAGYKSDLIKDIFQGWENIEIVLNDNYDEGMFSSIKTGLQHIQAERFFFLPGDYPLISASVYERMLDSDSEIVIPTYNGLSGHPVLFNSTVIKKVNNGTYNSLRELIGTEQPQYIEVDCPGILRDIDTIDDYQQVQDRLAE